MRWAPQAASRRIGSDKVDLETLPAFNPNVVRLRATITKNELVGIPGWTGLQFGVLSQWGTDAAIVGNEMSGFVGATPTGGSGGVMVGVPGLPGLVHPPSFIAFNRISDSFNGILALFSQRATIVLNRVVAGASGNGGIGVSGDDKPHRWQHRRHARLDGYDGGHRHVRGGERRARLRLGPRGRDEGSPTTPSAAPRCRSGNRPARAARR